MSGAEFPRSERLAGRADLEKVKKEGRRQVLPELVLFFYPFQRVERLLSPQHEGRAVQLHATASAANSESSIV
jgi:hypothetical protein